MTCCCLEQQKGGKKLSSTSVGEGWPPVRLEWDYEEVGERKKKQKHPPGSLNQRVLGWTSSRKLYTTCCWSWTHIDGSVVLRLTPLWFGSIHSHNLDPQRLDAAFSVEQRGAAAGGAIYTIRHTSTLGLDRGGGGGCWGAGLSEEPFVGPRVERQVSENTRRWPRVCVCIPLVLGHLIDPDILTSSQFGNYSHNHMYDQKFRRICLSHPEQHESLVRLVPEKCGLLGNLGLSIQRLKMIEMNFRGEMYTSPSVLGLWSVCWVIEDGVCERCIKACHD